MAGRGPSPKPSDERARRNADPTPESYVEPDGELHGPELPEMDEGWPAATRKWWETWRRSAQAQAFTDTDWSFLLDTALLHAEFWRGKNALAPELRLRVAKFGATMEDRARLRIGIGKPPVASGTAPAKPADEAKKAPRRDRILSLVEDAAG